MKIMRNSSGRLCLKIFLVSTLLYVIIPASWTRALFKGTPEEMTPTSPSPDKSVPNTVHFIRFGDSKLTFIDAVCLLAALKNQKPHKLYIHTDQTDFDELWGKYWKVVVNHPTAHGVIEVKYLRMPTSIYGKGFHTEFANYHASDVERLRVLIKYGGIYLDNDSYIVKSMKGFFGFEMTLGWENGGGISDQVLIAKRNATFLRLWLESYRDYRRDEWFYNAGEVPTEILKKRPTLAHAVKTKLAEYQTIPGLIYYQDSEEWRTHYAIHLLINHQYILQANVTSEATYPVEFNETNILKYPVIIRQMALDVYPFDEKTRNHYKNLYPQLASNTEYSSRGRMKKRRSTKSLDLKKEKKEV